MFNLNLEKFEESKGMWMLFAAFNIVVAPYWFIFNFSNDIYHKLDIFRLLLLCTSIGAPLAITNYYLTLQLMRLSWKMEYMDASSRKHLVTFCMSSCFNIIVLYPPTIYGFIWQKKFTFTQACNISIGLEIAIAVLSLIFIILSKEEPKKKNKQDVKPADENAKM